MFKAFEVIIHTFAVNKKNVFYLPSIVLVSGTLLENLMFQHEKVSSFNKHHPLTTDDDNASFTDSVLKWHTDFTTLIVSTQSQKHLQV